MISRDRNNALWTRATRLIQLMLLLCKLIKSRERNRGLMITPSIHGVGVVLYDLRVRFPGESEFCCKLKRFIDGVI